jgi:hypothetical protein
VLHHWQLLHRLEGWLKVPHSHIITIDKMNDHANLLCFSMMNH